MGSSLLQLYAAAAAAAGRLSHIVISQVRPLRPRRPRRTLRPLLLLLVLRTVVQQPLVLLLQGGARPPRPARPQIRYPTVALRGACVHKRPAVAADGGVGAGARLRTLRGQGSSRCLTKAGGLLQGLHGFKELLLLLLLLLFLTLLLGGEYGRVPRDWGAFTWLEDRA